MEISKEQYDQMLAAGAQKGVSRERIDASLASQGMTLKQESWMGGIASEAGKGILDIPRSIVQGARAGAEEYSRAGQALDKGNVGEAVARTASGIAGAAVKSAGGAMGGIARTALSPITGTLSAVGRATGLDKDAEFLAKKVAGSETMQSAVKGYQNFKEAAPGAAGVVEGAAEGVLSRFAPAGVSSLVSRSLSKTKGLAENISTTAGKRVAQAEVAGERMNDLGILKYFSEPTEKGLKGAQKNKLEISRLGGTKESRIGAALGATKRDPLVLENNKEMARVLREYKVTGNTRSEAQGMVKKLVDEVDAKRVGLTRNSIKPLKFTPEESIPKLISNQFRNNVKTEVSGSAVNIDNIVSDQGEVIAREFAKQMAKDPSAGWGGWMDKAITNFKAIVKASDSKAFDPDSLDGPARRQIAEEYRRAGRELIKNQFIRQKKGDGLAYEKLAQDERWLINAENNSMLRSTLDKDSITEALVSGSKAPMVLAGTAAGVGSVAAALLGVSAGGIVLTGLTAMGLSTLITGGAINLGGKMYTKSGVRKLLWKEVQGMTDKFATAEGEMKRSLAMEIAAGVTIMNLLNKENGDESAPKDDDID